MAQAAVATDQLLDLAATTLEQVTPDSYFNELIYQSYICEMFLKAAKKRRLGGTKMTFNSMLVGDENDTDDAADGVGVYGPYEVLGSGATDYQKKGETPWAYYATHWTLSSQDIELNDDREGFIDMVQQTKEGCITRLKNRLETHFWSRTSYAHEAAAKPWVLGPNYWITDDGYHVNDAGGTNSTKVGGLDPSHTDYGSRWRNQYQDIDTLNELPDAMEDLFIDCQFKAPPTMEMAHRPQFSKFKIVMDKTSYKGHQAMVKRLRDNTVKDMSSGTPQFNNVPIELGAQIPDRGDSTYETFFFNLDTWEAAVHKRNNFRKDKVITPPNQDARLQRIYLWLALFCRSRRQNGKVFGYEDVVAEG